MLTIFSTIPKLFIHLSPKSKILFHMYFIIALGYIKHRHASSDLSSVVSLHQLPVTILTWATSSQLQTVWKSSFHFYFLKDIFTVCRVVECFSFTTSSMFFHYPLAYVHLTFPISLLTIVMCYLGCFYWLGDRSKFAGLMIFYWILWTLHAKLFKKFIWILLFFKTGWICFSKFRHTKN